MPADANIFQQYLQAPKSVADYTAMYDQADARKNALAQSVLAMQKTQMDIANTQAVNQQRNALRDAVASGQIDLSNPEHVARAVSIAPDVAPAMLKTLQESATSRATATKDTALAGKANADTAQITAKTQADAVSHLSDAMAALQQLPGVTPAHVVASIQNAGKLYNIPDAMVQQAVAQVPQDPAQLPAFLQAKNAQLMSAKERMAYITPDANAQLQATTSRANNAATNATSRANNQATIAKDLTVAGLNPNGTPNIGNQDALIDMLGKYQLNPTLALQRLPVGARAALVAQVQAKYPGWDETTYDAKKGAAQKFTYGDQGNALRSVATASAHLDQLGELADAMGNGNTQVINKVGNYFATQMGDPKVTNFDAIKNIVGQEVVKAIVAGGGSAGERDEAAAAFKNASSPAQLQGAIQHYRAVMAAQKTNLLSQRRAAGLPDSTLPNYSDGGGGASAGGMPAISAIDAELARRGGK
jgi:hypothetical protein